MQTHVQVKRMSDGMRMFLIILLAPRTGYLPTPRAHVQVLVLVPECPCARGRVRVLECQVRVVLVLECSSTQVHDCS